MELRKSDTKFGSVDHVQVRFIFAIQLRAAGRIVVDVLEKFPKTPSLLFFPQLTAYVRTTHHCTSNAECAWSRLVVANVRGPTPRVHRSRCLPKWRKHMASKGTRRKLPFLLVELNFGDHLKWMKRIALLSEFIPRVYENPKFGKWYRCIRNKDTNSLYRINHLNLLQQIWREVQRFLPNSRCVILHEKLM